MSLFRTEVLEQRNDRLNGEVVFTQPLSTKLFAGTLFGIVALTAVWVSIGTYARIETVPGLLVTSVPSAKVVALQPGVVSELSVQEGQLVEKVIVCWLSTPTARRQAAAMWQAEGWARWWRGSNSWRHRSAWPVGLLRPNVPALQT